MGGRKRPRVVTGPQTSSELTGGQSLGEPPGGQTSSASKRSSSSNSQPTVKKPKEPYPLARVKAAEAAIQFIEQDKKRKAARSARYNPYAKPSSNPPRTQSDARDDVTIDDLLAEVNRNKAQLKHFNEMKASGVYTLLDSEETVNADIKKLRTNIGRKLAKIERMRKEQRKGEEAAKMEQTTNEEDPSTSAPMMSEEDAEISRAQQAFDNATHALVEYDAGKKTPNRTKERRGELTNVKDLAKRKLQRLQQKKKGVLKPKPVKSQQDKDRSSDVKAFTNPAENPETKKALQLRLNNKTLTPEQQQLVDAHVRKHKNNPIVASAGERLGIFVPTANNNTGPLNATMTAADIEKNTLRNAELAAREAAIIDTVERVAKNTEAHQTKQKTNQNSLAADRAALAKNRTQLTADRTQLDNDRLSFENEKEKQAAEPMDLDDSDLENCKTALKSAEAGLATLRTKSEVDDKELKRLRELLGQANPDVAEYSKKITELEGVIAQSQGRMDAYKVQMAGWKAAEEAILKNREKKLTERENLTGPTVLSDNERIKIINASKEYNDLDLKYKNCIDELNRVNKELERCENDRKVALDNKLPLNTVSQFVYDAAIAQRNEYHKALADCQETQITIKKNHDGIVKDLQTRLTDCGEKVNANADRIVEVEKEKEKLMDDNAKLKTENETLKNTATTLDVGEHEAVNELNRKLALSQATVESLKGDLKDCNETKNRLMENEAKLKADLTECKKRLSSTPLNVDEWERERDRYEKQFKEARAALRVCEATIRELKQDLERAEEQRYDKPTDAEHVSRLSALKLKLSELQNENTSLERQIKELKYQVKTSSSQLSECQRDIMTSLNAKTMAESRLGECENSKQILNNKIISLEHNIQRLEADLETCNRVKREAEAELSRLKMDRPTDEQQKRIDDLKAQVASLNHDLALLTNEKKAIERQLGTLQSNYNGLQHDLDHCKESLRKCKEDSVNPDPIFGETGSMTKMKLDLLNCREELGVVSKKLRDYEAKIQSLEGLLRTLEPGYSGVGATPIDKVIDMTENIGAKYRAAVSKEKYNSDMAVAKADCDLKLSELQRKCDAAAAECERQVTVALAKHSAELIARAAEVRAEMDRIREEALRSREREMDIVKQAKVDALAWANQTCEAKISGMQAQIEALMRQLKEKEDCCRDLQKCDVELTKLRVQLENALKLDAENAALKKELEQLKIQNASGMGATGFTGFEGGANGGIGNSHSIAELSCRLDELKSSIDILSASATASSVAPCTNPFADSGPQTVQSTQPLNYIVEGPGRDGQRSMYNVDPKYFPAFPTSQYPMYYCPAQ